MNHETAGLPPPSFLLAVASSYIHTGPSPPLKLDGTAGAHTRFPHYSPLKKKPLSVGSGERGVARVGQSFRDADKTGWESHDSREG